MTTVASLMVKLRMDAKSLISGFASGEASVKKFAGVVAVAGIAVGAVFAGMATSMAINFDKGMREVNTLINLSEQEFQRLEGDLMSLSNKMGIATTETVPALYQAISAGVPRENVFTFMEVASRAAIGGVTDLQTAVDGLTSVVNAYGVENLSVRKAADLMFTAVRLGKTTFEELSASLFNVVPIASAVGVGFEEVTAALAAMTAQGTPTAVATTQLRQLILALTAPTVRQVKVLKELGLEFNRDTLATKGLAGATKELIDLLGGNDQMLKRVLGSTEALQAALILGGKGSQTFAKDLDEMANSLGAVDMAFEEMEKSTSRRIARLKVNIETAMISIGLAILPLVDVLASVPPEVLAVTVGILALVVAVAAITAVLPLLITGVTTAGVAVGALAVKVGILQVASVGVLGPLALIVAAIAAVGFVADGILKRTTGHGLIDWLFRDPVSADAAAASLEKVELRVRQLTGVITPATKAQAKLRFTIDDLVEASDNWVGKYDKLTGVVRAFLGLMPATTAEYKRQVAVVEELAQSMLDQGATTLQLIETYNAFSGEAQDLLGDLVKIDDELLVQQGRVHETTLITAGLSKLIMSETVPAFITFGDEVERTSDKLATLTSRALAVKLATDLLSGTLAQGLVAWDGMVAQVAALIAAEEAQTVMVDTLMDQAREMAGVTDDVTSAIDRSAAAGAAKAAVDRDAAEQGAGGLGGGLLGILLARRLSQGLDVGAGLVAPADGGSFADIATAGRQLAPTDGGSFADAGAGDGGGEAAVIIEGDLIIGPDQTVADIGQGLMEGAQGVQRARLRAQTAAG